MRPCLVFNSEFTVGQLSKYLGESKVLKYFHNVRHNLTVLDVFVNVVKVKKHIGQ